MAGLFETTRLNNITLKNRFVRSATWYGFADTDGYPMKELTEVLVRLARGEVGLIISGHAYVSPEGQAGRRQSSMSRDDYIEPLREVVKAVHEAGGKIVAQIAHAGCEAVPPPEGSRRLGPSAVERNGQPQCAEMTHDDLAGLVQSFVAAAVRAKRAGFDGVQLHAAHGYLLSQFLSPCYNKRQDEYGGPVENRARILLEIVEAIRAAVGPAFPIMIKMNCEDFVEGGLTVDEMFVVSAMLEERSIDAIEMSGGFFHSPVFNPSRTRKRAGVNAEEAYYTEAARRYKEKIHVPLMLVGGIRSYERAEKLVAEGTTDYISLCRPLIAEPELIKRWKEGDVRPSVCKSDNRCFRPGFRGQGVRCVVQERKRGA